MRNSFDAEPRLMALTEAEIAAQGMPRTWMPESPVARTMLDPARWSRNARRVGYWRMGEIARRPR
ncbi:MAG TPA: hypothetical protein VFO35_00510 [Steroidobacteraceae bacterium]|nr:hypothetical protein [Steroidobacteraceae bacterium]